ncbi:ABC-type multidrug transport system, ATPase and permease components [Bellilinea caldifistulae]|uniref:ABC transporter n=1 Tax=Bellilinea caldifistulae TaxID=360411 RepID=A0A0P6XQB4_9CHLR|nr:ABC transporter ATP-binding protein [Bellilinea caldifistulae]KPL74461.1 ABC transporter [Bellilinea caldifistulae]GAP11645.1 ABC-type multidrug transport system, ATPase and permease components [Bellilinea caldifistulae]
MFRILKYLKPFALPLILAILLLFVQANADLALPDYLSRIVNVGIQQGGVENGLPQAMRQTTMQHLGLFLTSTEKEQVLNAYRLVDQTDADFATLVKTYPLLAEEPVYVLSETDSAVLQKLEAPVAEGLLIVSGIEQVLKDPQQAQTLMPGMSFDLSRLPAGMDVFTLMANLPETQRDQIRQAVSQRFETIGGEKALVQAAARVVRSEYDALGMDTGQLQTNYILRVGGQMLLISLLSAAAIVLVGFLASRVAAGLARNLRHLLFERVMRFSSAEIEKFSIASLITRSTNDITQIQMVMMILIRMVFYAPIIGIGGIIRAVNKSAGMWWIIAVAVIALIGLISIVFAIATPKFKIIQSLVDRLNLIARENLSGMMVVRAFNRQKYEEQRFEEANVDLTRTSLFVNRVFVMVMPFMMIILNGVSVLILWIGAHQVAQSSMQVGDMMAFMQYVMQIVFAFMMLSFLFILFPRADVSANRVADVLETDITVVDPPQPKSFPEPFRGRIEFKNVSFRYPDAEENVLCNLNFVAEAGKTTAIIGTTGSGKSTVVNLIPRFYDVTDGAILIDGVDIREVRLSELRDKIGYIPQQSNLFSGTIESNLRYANEEAAEEILKQALEIAQASEFVLSAPEGLQAPVSQGGINYSGGQKQRLSIARALVKRAPIYIFDDSFSALDYRTDARLRRALKQSLKDSTVIIVSQRVATIKDADQILVLDEGEIICKGTHEELLEKCEVYREIALSQLKREEVMA